MPQASSGRATWWISISAILAATAGPLKNRSRVRLHTGTCEILGNLILLEQDELAPGQETVAQLRLDTPVAVVKDDHFVVRSYSPVRTIGGGQVLNPIPPKHKRFKAEVVQGLKGILWAGRPRSSSVSTSPPPARWGPPSADLRLMTNLTDKQLDATLQGLMSARTIIQVDKESADLHAQAQLRGARAGTRPSICRPTTRPSPSSPACSKEELKSKLPPGTDVKLFNLVLNQMIKDNAIVQEEKTVRLKTHKVSLAGDEATLRQEMLSRFTSTAACSRPSSGT